MDNKPAFPDITTLLPHRPPIIVVDKVLAVEGLRTTTVFRVTADCIFTAAGQLSEMGMIENLAQTSFIFLNYYFAAGGAAEPEAKEKEGLGFISNITKLEVCLLPPVGAELKTTTEAELVFNSEILKICNIRGVITLNGQTALQAEMKMLLQSRSIT